MKAGELNQTQRKLLLALEFIGKLMIAGLIFRGILFVYPDTTGIQSAFADLIAAIISTSGLEAAADGIYIRIGDAVYIITQDCLGWKSKSVFSALVIASGITRRNLKFLASGIAVLLVANIVRVVTTIHLSHSGLISYEVIHGTLWKWGLTGVVLALWLYYLKNRGYEDLKTSQGNWEV